MNYMDFVKDHPIPGASLTQSKDKKLPYENPPEIVDMQEAFLSVRKQLTSKNTLPQLFRMLRQDIPVSDIAQTIVFTGFANGKWNFDLSLLLIEPTMLQIMDLAHKGGVRYVFSPEMPSLEAEMMDEDGMALEKALSSNEPNPGLMNDVEEAEPIDLMGEMLEEEDEV